MLESVQNCGSEKVIEDLKESLFYPFNIEGEYNAEYIQWLINCDERLKQEKDYTGIAPFGSSIKGYGLPASENEKGSDFDCLLIAGDATHKRCDEFGKILKEEGDKFGRKAHAYQICSLNYFESNFNPEFPNAEIYHALPIILYPIIGNKEEIERLREMARKKLETMNEGRRKKQVDLSVEQALRFDFRGISEESFGKIKKGKIDSIFMLELKKVFIERGFSLEKIEELMNARKLLWQSRVEDFYNKTGQFKNKS